MALRNAWRPLQLYTFLKLAIGFRGSAALRAKGLKEQECTLPENQTLDLLDEANELVFNERRVPNLGLPQTAHCERAPRSNPQSESGPKLAIKSLQSNQK